MRQKSVPVKAPAAQVVKNIRRATRRHFSAEDKIRIVLEGLRGEDSIAKLCRHEGIVQNLITAGRKTFWRRGRPQGRGPSRPQGRDPPNSPRVEASLVASARLLTRRMGLRHRS